MHLDANNLYRWAMSQKLPRGRFEWKKKIKFNENFIKSYGKDIFNFQFKFQLIKVEK